MKKEIHNPEEIPASKLPIGYRFLFVGEKPRHSQRVKIWDNGKFSNSIWDQNDNKDWLPRWSIAIKDSEKKKPTMKKPPQIWNPENIPAENLPEGFRFLNVGESVPKGTPYWLFYFRGPQKQKPYGGLGDREPFTSDGETWKEIQSIRWTYAVPISKKETPAPIENKNQWIAWKDRAPTKADLPIKVTISAPGVCSIDDGADYSVRKLWPIRKADSDYFQWTHWMHDDTPPIPKPIRDPFEEWWAAQGYKQGKKAAQAAWNAAKEAE